MRFVRAISILGALSAMPAMANLPVWDNSGNSLLNGAYYFREVIYVYDTAGDITEELATYGQINFTGTGSYTIPSGTVNVCQSSGCNQQALTYTGTYTFGANGYGFFSNPLSTSSGSYTDYGLISNGILIASATEQGFNSLFIATPISSPAATASSFSGTYQIAGFIPGSGSAATAADVSYQLNPNGAGSLGTVGMTGYIAGDGATTYTQSSAAKYIFSNGAGVITYPTSTTAPFYSGQVYLYISPDRNFVFGGSPSGFDMFVGVKTGAGPTNFSGLYYEGGIDDDASQWAASGYTAPDTYYGSFSANGGNIVGHQRLFTPIYDSVAEGLTYSTTYPAITGNGYTDSGNTTQYTFGNNGTLRIGFGMGPYLGIRIAVQAPAFSGSGSGPYLNPTGIVSAASFAPFTAGVSPGEFIVLYGTGMASGTTVAGSLPFPTTLGGVQVTVNGINAPIYYVTPGQIAVIVPYSASYTPLSGALPIARIQVTNNGSPSNAVTLFFNQTTPGIFSQTANGLGLGAIEHALTGQVVTEANPAQPGEIVAIYLAGLGTTFPSVTEGTAGPTSPLANTINNFSAYVGGDLACGSGANDVQCPFVGLAPYLAGVYQFNLQIPSTATQGDNLIEILGPDSDNYQTFVPVGNGLAGSSIRTDQQSAAHAVSPRSRKRVGVAGRTAPCFIVDSWCGASR